jgi:hypothetical protein
MFKKIAIVSAIVIMTAMIAAIGVTTTLSMQVAHAAQTCRGGINVCNIQACVQANAIARLTQRFTGCTA